MDCVYKGVDEREVGGDGRTAGLPEVASAILGLFKIASYESKKC